MPLNTSDPQVVLLGDKVYVGGGFAIGERSMLFIYDFKEDSWVDVYTPTTLYSLTAYRSQLVLVGGIEKNTPTNHLWVLDAQGTTGTAFNANNWTKSHPDMPTSRWGASAVSVENHLIVAGGDGGGVVNPVKVNMLNVVEIYNGDYWRKAPSLDLPKPCYFMKSALHDGNWYLAGGAEQGYEIFCTSLESLIHPEGAGQTSVWKEKELPNMPLELSTPVVFEEHLMTVGGKPDSSAIHAYSPNTNSWEHIGNLPAACHSTCALVLPTGELLVAGGKTGAREDSSCVFRAKFDTFGLLEEFMKQQAELENLKVTLQTTLEQKVQLLVENQELKRKPAQDSDGKNTPRKPELKALMDALYRKVADRWSTIGVHLGIQKGDLAVIAEKYRDDPHKCLIDMLMIWLEQTDPPATWVSVIEAVEFLGEEWLGKELRQKYTSSI